MIKEPARFFPDPQLAMSDGLVSISDELSVDILKEAYGKGIFPWPHEESPILWFSPDPRGILYFSEMHLAKSFKKFLKTCQWEVSWNHSFNRVIENCAQVPRQGESGTWITEHMKEHYKVFHAAGYAHSVEVWDKDELIGGVYGVFVDGSFSGESMFFKKSQASKVALFCLISQLKKIGLQWLDIQMVTPNLNDLGGRYIDRDEFYKELELAQDRAHLLKTLTPWRAPLSVIIAEGL